MVTKVKQLVNVAKINSTLASTVVTIMSNVMSSSETALAASSETYELFPTLQDFAGANDGLLPV